MNKQGFIDVHGKSLEYQWIPGNSDASTLVLLHEGLGCVKLWKNFPDSLAQATGCSVFSYSRAGYGGSSPCKLPRSVRYMHEEAELLSTVLNHVPGESLVLTGHSDGASIATIYAGNNPDREIEKLVLLAPHFLVEEMTVQSIEKIKSIYKTTDLRQRLMKYHGDQIDIAFWGWNDIWLNPEFRAWNICEFLPNLEIPILILQGGDDEYGSVAQIEIARLHACGPVESQIIAGCGHTLHTIFEQETVARITEFVAAA